MSVVENLVNELLDKEVNIGGVAVLSQNKIVYQTENWDLTAEIPNIVNATKGGSSIALLGIKYMIVENTPERVIGTNVTGKGHLIIAPFPKGIMVCYIVPQIGPRDALFNVQTYALKLNAKL
jgi:hypothetical protein